MYETYQQQPFYPPQTPGVYYPNPVASAKNTQPLTAEQINKLRQNEANNNLKLTQEEIWIAACTHKEKNGASALIKNSDGSYTCSICQTRFNFKEATEKEVQQQIDLLKDYFNTMKTIYLDIPADFLLYYSQSWAMIQKFPTLFNLSVNNFAKYETPFGVDTVYPGPQSGFDRLYQTIYPGYGAYGAYAPTPQGPMPVQPNGQVQYAYPQQSQTPVYTNPVAPIYAQPGGNPLGYGAPAPAPVAMDQQQQMVAPPMNIPTAPVAPQVPMIANPGMVQTPPQAQPAQQQPVQNPDANQAKQQSTEVQQQQVFNV